MDRKRKTLRLIPLLCLVAVPGLEAQAGGSRPGPQSDFLRAAAEYFNVAPREAVVLSQWGLRPAEVPVVLFVAGRAGVSPDVIVAQRERGRPWRSIGEGLGVHASDLYVRQSDGAGFLRSAYEQFESLPPARWGEVELTDADVVGLVNVRFLSRYFEVTPGEAIRAFGRDGDAVEAYRALAAGRVRGR